MFDNTSLVTLYAVTPCHAGSGSSVGVVDLPIQRERHTNYPIIRASGVKGAFRANFRNFKTKEKVGDDPQFNSLEDLIFGSSDPNNAYMGALAITDAKILAFPMRSSVAPFLWITCPAVLKRLVKDLEIAGLPSGDISSVLLAADSEQAYSVGSEAVADGKILLEDIAVEVKKGVLPEELKKYFAQAERLLVVSDKVFDYGITECNTKEIRISKEVMKAKQSDSEIYITLVHEIIHAVLDTGQYLEESQKESLVEWLARCIISLLKQDILCK